jgi:hypothetical protein
MLNPNNWSYCEHCDTPAYLFDCCGMSSCSGGGCETCAHLFNEVNEAIVLGTYPNPLKWGNKNDPY